MSLRFFFNLVCIIGFCYVWSVINLFHDKNIPRQLEETIKGNGDARLG
jgi:hypothetical protein